MGIDYDGGMVVGEIGGNLDEEKMSSLTEESIYGASYFLVEENGMKSMSQYFDCDFEYITFGFSVDDINVDEIDQNWIDGIKEKARKFEEITGVKAKLIGCQNIY